MIDEPGSVRERVCGAVTYLSETDLADPDRRGCMAVNTAAEPPAENATAVQLVSALCAPDRRSALLAFFDHCIRSITAGTSARGCLSTRTVIDASAEVAQVETAARRFLDALEDVVHDGLAVIEDGDLAVDLRSAARLVVTTTRGLAVMERAHHGPTNCGTSPRGSSRP